MSSSESGHRANNYLWLHHLALHANSTCARTIRSQIKNPRNEEEESLYGRLPDQ